MKININYPTIKKPTFHFENLRIILGTLMIPAALACVIVNLCIGGPAWSVVVIWSEIAIWRIFLSPDLLEFNLISQTIKPVFYAVILLALIHLLIVPTNASFIIPIVVFGALLTTTVFLFIDTKTQMHNIMPMFWAIFFSILVFILALCGVIRLTWPMIVLGCVAIGITLICIIRFKFELIEELKKRFHI